MVFKYKPKKSNYVFRIIAKTINVNCLLAVVCSIADVQLPRKCILHHKKGVFGSYVNNKEPKVVRVIKISRTGLINYFEVIFRNSLNYI